LQPDGAATCLHVHSLGLAIRIVRIDQQARGGRIRNKLAQHLQSLRAQRPGEHSHTGNIPTRPVEAGNETRLDGVGIGQEDDGNGSRRAIATKVATSPPRAKMADTRLRTRSTINFGRRSRLPSVERNSMTTFLPSMNPSSWSPPRNAVSGSSAVAR